MKNEDGKITCSYRLNPDTVRRIEQWYEMSKVFQQISLPEAGPRFAIIDRKRRREIMEKRIALGHREDDHEEAANYKYMEPTMSMW